MITKVEERPLSTKLAGQFGPSSPLSKGLSKALSSPQTGAANDGADRKAMGITAVSTVKIGFLRLLPNTVTTTSLLTFPYS